MDGFNPVELIVAKRDGAELAPEAVKRLIDGYTRGDVPDYQMSAFLMAAFLRGFSEGETAALTEAMLYSGTILDLTDTPGTKVDKHSTGGVGDKVSLILAPIVAACGVPVPMISGRGLGHTGGTLDKLESIPGFRTDLSVTRFIETVRRHGIGMIGQTEEIAPADRKLYALRDVTGSVEFIPFIAASIMSKKLAAGIDALVLDVKCGRGAFMKTEAHARLLAETLVGIGERFGKPTVAWLTGMDRPLGRAIGNWPEVMESIGVLRGERAPDVLEVTLALAGEMLRLGGAAPTLEEGIRRAEKALETGAAFEKFVELVRAQGGDPSVLYHPDKRAISGRSVTVTAPENAEGFVAGIDAYELGKVTVALGAGRIRKEDEVDPTAGIVLNKALGEPVEAGEPLAVFYTTKQGETERFAERVRQAFSYAPRSAEPGSLLMDRYADGRWGGRGTTRPPHSSQ